MIRVALLALAVAALPGSGPISLGQVQTEFGGASPISLSEYYKGGAYVATSENAPNVPTSGTISLSRFYWASNTIAVAITVTSGSTFSGFCNRVTAGSCTATTTAANASASGGTAPYTYSWAFSPGSGTQFSISNASVPNPTWSYTAAVPPGPAGECNSYGATYCVTARDANGNAGSKCVTVGTSHCYQL